MTRSPSAQKLLVFRPWEQDNHEVINIFAKSNRQCRSLKFLDCDWVETIFLAPHHLSMAENTAFSSSGQDIISRPVELDEGELQLTQNLTKAQLAEFYDIDRIVDEILSNHFKRVRHHGLRIYSCRRRDDGSSRSHFNSQMNFCMIPSPSTGCSSGG